MDLPLHRSCMVLLCMPVYSLLAQVLETDSSPGSIEIVSVAEVELPGTDLCLFFKRFFCTQQAKVDPSENENGKTSNNYSFGCEV